MFADFEQFERGSRQPQRFDGHIYLRFGNGAGSRGKTTPPFLARSVSATFQGILRQIKLINLTRGAYALKKIFQHHNNTNSQFFLHKSCCSQKLIIILQSLP